MTDSNITPPANPSPAMDGTIRLPDNHAAQQPSPAIDRTIVLDRNRTGLTLQPDANADGDHTLRPAGGMGMAEEAAAANTFLLKADEYAMVKCLSDNSGEAQVFLVRRNGQEFVLKVYYPNFDVSKKLLQVIHSFRFEMIVRLIDFGKTYVEGKHRFYELMEYLRGGTLQEYGLAQDFNKFRRLALQAASALAYCHKNNILHKDIKPSNFFFRDTEHRQLVLGDFGISSLVESDGRTHRTTQARTPVFAAPEMYSDVIDGEVEITPAADYYSLGITLFALWLGENPMSANEREMMRQKNEGRLPRMNELPEKVRHIVQGLTAVNPLSRWTYREVERWFLGEDVAVDVSSPFLRYKSFIVDPEYNLVAENVHELVPMMLDHERLCTGYLYDGRIATWLETCGNTRLATVLKDIVINRYPSDRKAGLMAAVYAMEPDYPYCDASGKQCRDVHDIALSLLSLKDKYGLLLANPGDSLYLWLETHTKCNVDRLRSYFGNGAEPHVAVLRMVYEIDPDIPFMARRPSASLSEIVSAFGKDGANPDDWHSLCDGRLLSWTYSHEDMVVSESLRGLTEGQPYSQTLAYKVLYSMDRDAAYDLNEARTSEEVGQLLRQRLVDSQHLPAADFTALMQDMAETDGRFEYYAKLHGWTDLAAEVRRCFDLTSDENRDRLGAYDLRTASYRFCRILGVTPVYQLRNGHELTDGRNIPTESGPYAKEELHNGSMMAWMAAFYHEDPTRDFTEQYSYERELENWLKALGSIDQRQQYYVRYMKALKDTAGRVTEVRRLWNSTRRKEQVWRYGFYGLCAIWCVLVVWAGFSETGREYIVTHFYQSIILPVGGMCGVILATRAFFKGFGVTLSTLWGSLGVLSSLVPVYLLRYVNGHYPHLFAWAVLLLTVVYVLVCILTDFRHDQQTDAKTINNILKSEDINSTLLDPLYYTFKTKSLRYKSSKFSLLDDVSNQIRSLSGESAIHYMEWSFLVLILVAMMVAYSPRLMDMKTPSRQWVNETIEQVEQIDEALRGENE